MMSRVILFVGLFAVAVGLAACVGGPVPATNAASSATSGNAPLRPIVRVPPKYPTKARIGPYEGTLMVCFTVKRNGLVADATVKSFTPFSVTSLTAAPAAESAAIAEFGNAAIAALHRWKFSPRMKNGKAVATKGVCQSFMFKMVNTAPNKTLPPLVISETKAAAAQGNASAEEILAAMYMRGLGVAKDNAKAISLLRKSAKHGDLAARYVLAMLYYEGKVVKRDYHQAFRLCRKAAEAGLATAQATLGGFYSKGIGTRKDQAKAVEWIRKAAKQGNSYGELMLARAYLGGHGVKQSPQAAVQWYRLAAEGGNAKAADELAHLYEGHQGVAKNCARAFYWYKKAAAGGNADAKKMLQTFGKEKDGVCYAQGT